MHYLNLTRTAGLALLISGWVLGSTPELHNIACVGTDSRGGQRNTEIEVIFYGVRLDDAKQVLFYKPGISVTELKVVNTNQVKVKLKITADAPLGEHQMRIVTATGITELKTFMVGLFPTLQEKEPNSEFTAPQVVALNTTVVGRVDYEDVDHFIVEAKKGQRISAEIEAIRLGGPLFDPHLSILDSKRFELVQEDDTPLLARDSYVSVLAPADGKYIVRLRETSYGGNGAFQYRLHVGNFPRAVAVYPAGGKIGDEVAMKLLGDVSGEVTVKRKLTDIGSDFDTVFGQDGGGMSPSGNVIRLVPFGNQMEQEPNNDLAKSNVISALPIAVNGVISEKGDVDEFKAKLTKGQTFDVHVYARRLRTPLDPVLEIYNAKNGGGIAGNDDAIGPDSYLRFTAPEDGEFVFRVRDHLNQGGPNFIYRLEFQPVVAALNTFIPQVAIYSQERQTVPVPKNGRYATMMAVTRTNFGGEVNFSSPDLPAGVKMNLDNVPANLNLQPVVFEADASAVVGGKLCDLLGKCTDPKQPITGKFLQPIELVNEGQNYRPYYVTNVDKLAVAVTDELPFKVNIVEPKVPIVRDGQLNVKVVAERKKDYKAAINLFMLFNPPGVGSSYSVTIPEGQTEILYPVNANGGAELKKWKIAMLAQAGVGNGPIWTSSQLATLEVAAPFLTAAIDAAAIEQGKTIEVVAKFTHQLPFDGEAVVSLVGLPGNTTATPAKITKDSKEVVFKVTAAANSPQGQHQNLFCQITIMKNGEPIVHNCGYGGKLRIDPPAPPKKEEPKAAAVPMPNQPAAPAAAAPKRLTRLEQLRLEQAEKAKKGG